jgi:hypothetical protein
LEFAKKPHQKSYAFQPRFNDHEIKEISMELERLLSIGAVEKCEHEEGEFVSHIFTRRKPNGKIRVILNLKPLNQFLIYEHFKMEHINFVTDLVEPGDWFSSIDLSDAYFSISIHKNHWKYLRFNWGKHLFQYKVMVFGASVAPRIFTRICKPILSTLRATHFIRCSLYIDDMIIMNRDKAELIKEIKIVTDMFSCLGFTINLEKSVFEPTQTI